jgi:hypothetical protein
MAAAETGCAHLDKGMADEGHLRLVRRFELDKEGKFVDHKLEKRAPLLFALLKIIMEEHGCDQVALQKMLHQKMHCDPHAANFTPKLDAGECHVLVTVNGAHALGLSTSSKIQTEDESFKTWAGGGRGANKLEPRHLNDVLLVPRGGPWPLQVVCQSLLGGSVALESDLEPMIPVHAGVPCDIKCDSGGPGLHWMTAQEYGELILARKKAFREREGEGTPVSTSMLCNYFGTQGDAAAAFEDAALRVLQAHQGFKRMSGDRPVRFHERDLAEFKDMLDRGEITTLAHQHHNPLKNWAFWSAGRQQRHVTAIVAGGGSAKGAMSEPERDKHAAASVAGGASAKGAMSKPERKKHAAAIVAGGGSTKGAMSEPERKKHAAAIVAGGGSTGEAIAQGHLDMNRRMMQLANGKVGQQNLWECCISKNGSGTLYRFRAANEAQIDGVGKFRKYLLDVRNGYVHDNLTKEGAEARIAMENTRKVADKCVAYRERKRQREEK